MPEISRFLGIVIFMYFREHNPPHFHAEYGEQSASIDIARLCLLEGRLAPRILSLVIEWAALHQDELLRNWHWMQTSGEFRRIAPLT